MFEGARKNIWSDLSKGVEAGHSFEMNEIVELAKQTSLDGVNVENVEEILQETAKLWTNLLKVTQILTGVQKTRRGVMDTLSTYQPLPSERKRKTQITLDTFLIKMQEIGNTEDTE
ncbi:hypothetical protein TNCT_306071 [Trichonephila clavata]|uniref:Uncharacterized protein n=1 Tax=Trichonephila clavata TaxID=2740835 RepID=A0A8X6IUF0_TRICU|nr:hypothetical protein TNCT_306071 [Trichonephila clavata]